VKGTYLVKSEIQFLQVYKIDEWYYLNGQ